MRLGYVISIFLDIKKLSISVDLFLHYPMQLNAVSTFVSLDIFVSLVWSGPNEN